MKNRYFKRALAFLLTLTMLCTSGPFSGGSVMAEAAEPEVEATETETVEVAEPGEEENAEPGAAGNLGDETDGEADYEAQVTYDAQVTEEEQPLYDENEDHYFGVAIESADKLEAIWNDPSLLWGEDSEEGEDEETGAISPYEGMFRTAPDLTALFEELSKVDEEGGSGNPIDVKYVYISQINPKLVEGNLNVYEETISVPATIKGMIIGSGWYEGEEGYDFGVIVNSLNIQGTDSNVYFEKGVDVNTGNDTELTINFEGDSSNSKVFFSNNVIDGAIKCDNSPETGTIVFEYDNILNGYRSTGTTEFVYDGKLLINKADEASGVSFENITGETDAMVIYNGYPENSSLLPHINAPFNLGEGTDDEGNNYYRGLSIAFWEYSDKPFFLIYREPEHDDYDWWNDVRDEYLPRRTQVAYFGRDTEDNIDNIFDISRNVHYYYHTERDEGEPDLYIDGLSGRLEEDGYDKDSPYSIAILSEDEFNNSIQDSAYIWENMSIAKKWENAKELDTVFGYDGVEYVAIQVKRPYEDEGEDETENTRVIDSEIVFPDTVKGAFLVSDWDDKANEGEGGRVPWNINSLSVEGAADIYVKGITISPGDEVDSSGQELSVETSDSNAVIHFVDDSEINGDLNIKGNAKVELVNSHIKGNLKGSDSNTVTIQDMFITNGITGFEKVVLDNRATILIYDVNNQVKLNKIEFSNINDDTYFDLMYNGYPENEDNLPEIDSISLGSEADQETEVGLNIRYVKTREGEFWIDPEDTPEEENWWNTSEDIALEPGAKIIKVNPDGEGAVDDILQRLWYQNEQDYGIYYDNGWIVVGQVDEGTAYRVLRFKNANDFESAKNEIGTIWEAEENYGIDWSDTDSPDDFLSGDGVNYVVIQAMKKSHTLGDKTLTLPANIRGAILVPSGDDDYITEEGEPEVLVHWLLDELVVKGEAEVIIDGVTFDSIGQGLNITAEAAGTNIVFRHSNITGDVGDLTVSDKAKAYFNDTYVDGSVNAKNIEIEDRLIAAGITGCDKFSVNKDAFLIINNPKGVTFKDIELLEKNEGNTNEEYNFNCGIIYNGYPKKDTSLLPKFTGDILVSDTPKENVNYGINIRFIKQKALFWQEDNWWEIGTGTDVVLEKEALVATTTVSETDVEAFVEKIWYNPPKEYEPEGDNAKVWLVSEPNNAGGYNIVVRYAEGIEPDVEPDEPEEPDETAKPVINSVLFPKKKETYSAVYTGEQIRPVMVVAYKYTDEKGKAKTQTLKLNVDYTLSYSDNVDVGENAASVTVKGIGEYSGNITKEFTITPKSIAKVKLSPVGDIKFGEEPTVVVMDGNYQLEKDVDYEIVYSPEGSASADTQSVLTVKGKGNYDKDTTSKSKAKFNILGNETENANIKSIAADTVNIEFNKLPAKGYTYNGKQQKPKVIVTDGGVKVPSSQYKVIYTDNVNAGTATVKVVGVSKKGKGYYGVSSKELTFEIKQKDLTKVKVSSVAAIPKTGTLDNITLTVKDGKRILTEDEEYTVDYSNILDENEKIKDDIVIGQKYTVTLTATGKGNYIKDSKKEIKVKFGQLNLASKTANISMKILDPAQNKVEVKYNGVTLTDSDYTATVKLDKKKGTYTVTIKAVKKSAYKGKKVFKGVTFNAPETEQ